MPRLDLLSWIVWGVVIASQVVLSAIVVRRRLWERWSALSLYIGFRTVVSLALLTIMLVDNGVGDTIPRIYFHTYWRTDEIASLIQLWLIVELGRHVTPMAGKVLAVAVPAIAFVFATGALLGQHRLPDVWWAATRHAVVLERSVSLGLLGAFIALWAVSELLNIRWTRFQLGISLGFLLQAIDNAVVAFVQGEFPHLWYQNFNQHRNVLTNLHSAIWIIALSVWAAVLIKPEDLEVDDTDLDSLQAILTRYIQVIKRLRG
jgi:hypothetical protein